MAVPRLNGEEIQQETRKAAIIFKVERARFSKSENSVEVSFFSSENSVHVAKFLLRMSKRMSGHFNARTLN